MKFLEYRECVVLDWDMHRNIYSAKLKVDKKGKILVREHFSASGENFSQALGRLLKLLKPQEDSLIIAGGPLGGAVCIEFSIPKLEENDRPSAVEYELSRLLPTEVSGMVNGFRCIPSGKEENKLHMRVVSMLRSEWDEVVNDIFNSGVKLDSIVHPFIAIDPLLGSLDEIYLRGVEPEFIFQKNPEKKFRYCVKTHPLEHDNPIYQQTKASVLDNFEIGAEDFGMDENVDDYLPCLLIGAYSLSENFDVDRPFLLPVPKSMIPERFRGLRILFIVLCAIATLLLAGLAGRNMMESYRRLGALKAETDSVTRKIKDIKKENLDSRKFDEFIAKISDIEPEMGNHEALFCLHQFNKLIPKDMWMTNLSVRKDIIEATILSDKDAKDDLGDFTKTKLFSKQELNKRMNPDQSKNIYLKLYYVPPVKRIVPEEDKDE